MTRRLLDRTRTDPTVGHDLATALTGTLLIAATYGLARFGVGLHGPRLADQVPGAGAVLGTATAAQFLAYCCSALAAAVWSDHRPRLVLALSGATAVTGCSAIAVAPNAATLVAAAFVAGLGAGFASPALVRLVDATVTPARGNLVQGIINTGTAVGVVVAGLLSFVLVDVASAWLTMAALTALAAVAALWTVRRADVAHERSAASRPLLPRGTVARLRRPAVAALLAGVGSALVWSHAPTLLARAEILSASRSGWLWMVLGLGGLGGVLTAAVARRLGTRAAWALHCVLLASSTALLGVAVGREASAFALVGAAVFGLAYMCLSGTLILVALERVPSAAGAATSGLFVALALGQSIGSVVLDRLAVASGPVVASVAATTCCLLAAAVPWGRRRSRSSSRAGGGCRSSSVAQQPKDDPERC